MGPAILVLAAVGTGSWYFYPGDDSAAESDPMSLVGRPRIVASIEPEFDAAPIRRPAEPEPKDEAKQPAPEPKPDPAPAPDDPPAIKPASVEPVEKPPPPAEINGSIQRPIDAAREALGQKDLLKARGLFSEALAREVDATTIAQVRNELSKIGEETIFSSRIIPGDPLIDRYVIKAGDHLAKIASQFGVTADLLASLNGIADKHRIREGQTIKVIKGPMRAVVRKRSYLLDVYLGDVLVRSFPVGLGADDSTPKGEWRIRNKLENPTYYPPRGGTIVSADDPANPLGERWIGLEGVSGEAVAQERYGIHGTNEPDSIGKSVSLGCIRLHNADAELLYSYLVEGRSTVTVTD